MTVSNKKNTIRRYHLYDSIDKKVELEKDIRSTSGRSADIIKT